MRKTNILIVLWIYLLTNGLCDAQHETDHWIFGNKVGISFSSKVATTLQSSKMHQVEGVAVISDRNSGRLLFYTDGVTIWNSSNQSMKNGDGLLGSSTSTQSALIVPSPRASSEYYLFTVKAYNDGNNSGLHYSIVDMNLDGGSGDIILGSKNILIESRTTEKLTAIPHANGKDYWVISHAWDSNEFLIYLLSANGISHANRIAIGTIHRASSNVKHSEAMGYLKASPDGSKIASAVYGNSRPFELYDFDNSTGLIYNYRNLGEFNHQYGVSFSPNNQKLYLSGLYSHDGSYKFDLEKSNIIMSKISFIDTLHGKPIEIFLSGALQLGVDGKLYSAGRSPIKGKSIVNHILVLDDPDDFNKESNIARLEFKSLKTNSLLGLPNFIQNTFNKEQSKGYDDNANYISIYPNPIVNNKLTVEILMPSKLANGFSVYNLSGQEIYHSNQSLKTSFVIDTSTWEKGMIYLIKFINTSNILITKRVLKY